MVWEGLSGGRHILAGLRELSLTQPGKRRTFQAERQNLTGARSKWGLVILAGMTLIMAAG